MRLEEFESWVDDARRKGAVVVEVRRARSFGADGKLMFSVRLDETFEYVRLVERMVEDVATRGAPSAPFAVSTKDAAGGEVMSDRVDVTRDGAGSPVDREDESSPVKLARTMSDAADRAYRTHDAFALRAMELIAKSAEAHAAQSEKLMAGVSGVLTSAFQLAQMREESAAAIRASEERRVIASNAIQTLGPIAGALLSKLTGGQQAAIASLLGSLTQEQFERLSTVLTPEQLAVFADLLDASKKEGE